MEVDWGWSEKDVVWRVKHETLLFSVIDAKSVPICLLLTGPSSLLTNPSTSTHEQFALPYMPSAFSLFGAHPAAFGAARLPGSEFGGLGSLAGTLQAAGSTGKLKFCDLHTTRIPHTHTFSMCIL